MTWTVGSKPHKLKEFSVRWKNCGDGVKFVIIMDGVEVMESVRTYLDKRDAKIHASHWLDKIGYVITDDPA